MVAYSRVLACYCRHNFIKHITLISVMDQPGPSIRIPNLDNGNILCLVFWYLSIRIRMALGLNHLKELNYFFQPLCVLEPFEIVINCLNDMFIILSSEINAYQKQIKVISITSKMI